MPSEVTAQWREKASGFFYSSGLKLKQAGQSAGSFVGDKARDAGENVVDAASKVGSLVKKRWRRAFLQKAMLQCDAAPAGLSIQERMLSAASSTLVLLRDGISETKKKVVAGKMKVEEVAKRTEDKSKTMLNNIKRWQKGVASTDGEFQDQVITSMLRCFHCRLNYDVFGMPIEATVKRQQSALPVPQVLVICADFIVSSGLKCEYLFKAQGDRKVLQHLILLYNQDCNASLPKGITAIDVAALVKCYLFSLPEPLTTFALYHELRNARSSLHDLRSTLKKLPDVNYMTLKLVTFLLLRVSQNSLFNKMDAHSLSMELAPAIMWKKDDSRLDILNHLGYTPKVPSKPVDLTPNPNAWVVQIEDDQMDASAKIPLDDDGSTSDYGAIEVIQCLIEHHYTLFTDANICDNIEPT